MSTANDSTDDRNVAQESASFASISDTGSDQSSDVVIQHSHSYFVNMPGIEIKDCFYGVPAENFAFVDRPSILASMEVALASPSKGCRTLALKGLGGMGKTQLMLRYCYLHRAAYEFVFWLEMDSWSTAICSFRNLAINLGIDEKHKEEINTENKLIDWVRSWLHSKTKWLLLLNNVDGTMSQDVFKLLPRIGGDIILTTRESIPRSLAEGIPVGKMQEEEALLLLFGVFSKDLIEQESPNLQYARDLINELDFMPLAIDFARAYLKNTLTSPKDYLSMIKAKNERVKWLGYRKRDNLSKYKRTVTSVWQLSLEQVRAENPVAVQILQACTFLRPENIPVCLFKNQYSALKHESPFPFGNTFRKTIARLFKTRTEKNTKDSVKAVQEAVAVLVKFSFVRKTCFGADDGEENTNDVLTIHRLVQKAIYDTITSDQRLRWAHNIATALNKDIDFDNPCASCSQRNFDTYLPHIHHFVTILNNVSKRPFKSFDLSNLLNQVIECLVENGTYSGISEFLKSSRLILETTYGKKDMCICIMGPLFKQAYLYQQWGNYNEAETLLRRALAIKEKANANGSETAHSLTHLAEFYEDWGRYDEAEMLYKRALEINKKTLGLEHTLTAHSMQNLGKVCAYRKDFAKAQEWYLQAGAIFTSLSINLSKEDKTTSEIIKPPTDIVRETKLTLERFWDEVANSSLQNTVQQLLNSDKYAPSVVFTIGVFCELGMNIPKDFSLAMKLFTKVTTAKNSDVYNVAKIHQENLLNQLNERDHDLSGQPCGREYLMGEEYYMCYTCGDSNSCLCLRCFYSTNHDDHDVIMEFNCCSGMGSCDCGVPDSWKIDLDCQYHKASLSEPKSLAEEIA